jgi:hypothetical protein
MRLAALNRLRYNLGTLKKYGHFVPLWGIKRTQLTFLQLVSGKDYYFL